MKPIVSVALVLVISAAMLPAQATEPAAQETAGPIKGKSRTEVVDEVWRLATQGKLLTPEGWNQASRYFTAPAPFPEDRAILVVSNEWGPAYDLHAENSIGEVGLGYGDMGKIDSELHYTPPARTEAAKIGFLYRLVAVPAYMKMYRPDGTLIEKKPVGYRVWQIQGSPGRPWTTVNTAIRYVLEMRAKVTDASIRRNADETLAALLKLH